MADASRDAGWARGCASAQELHSPRAPRPAPRVAIVHDWLTGMRGGEKVLEEICLLYPDATIFTLVRVKGSVSPVIERHPIRTSWVQRLPRAGRWYRHYLLLYPFAVESFDLDGYDLVISSSHCAVKSVIREWRRDPRLLLPLPDALCLGPVSVVFRAGSGRCPAERRAAGSYGRAGPVGRRHRGAGGPLSR